MPTTPNWRRFMASVGICLAAITRVVASEVVEYHSRAWQLADGLPHASVQSIAQTADGYLWVGTQKGLVRFDGVRFRPFQNATSPQLANAAINALLVTPDGTLWIGTAREGLFRLKGDTIEPCPLPGAKQPPILVLAGGQNGEVWIGLRDGVCRWLPESQKAERIADVPATTIRAIHPTPSGTVWFGTSSGLMEWQGKIESRYTHTNGLKSSFIRAVKLDRDGVLWSGSNNGIARMHRGAIKHFTMQHGLRDNTISAIYQDRHGTLWVGSFGGLNRWENGKFISEFTADGLPYDVIFAFFEDAEGNLWIGAKDGLHRLNPKRFKTFTTKQGLSHNNVMSVLEDKGGTLWVGTWGGGLTEISGDVIRHINSATNGVPLDLVLGLGESHDGSLWVGTDYNNGLFHLKGGTASRFNDQNRFPNYVLRVVLVDRRTNVWVGTGEGLMRLAGGKISRFGIKNGLPGTVVRTLLEDSAGRIWVGTESGLAIQERDRFMPFPTNQPIAAPVISLYEDREKTLWIGTLGQGLMRWRDGELTTITKKEGLFSNDIFEVVEDDHGRLWMSCLQGFFHLPKDDFEAVKRGTISTVTCVSFGSPGDDTHVQCNGVAKPAAIKRRDGTLAFASTKGLILIDPRSDLRRNEKPPPVVVDSIIAGGSHEFVCGKTDAAGIKIPPGESVAIHYTALSFRAPEKNRFRYKLENFNDEWIDAGTDRIANYSKLPHGDYRFRVLACNNDGIWNEQGAEVAFSVLPEFWQTWWFKAISFGGVGALGFLGYRTRVARIRQLEGLRLRIAADLHDDIGADLTKLSLLVESAMRDHAQQGRTRSALEEAMTTSREVIMAMDEIVWTIKPKNDTLENLANYIFRYSQRYCKNTGIRCTLDIPADLPALKVPTDVRHNLFLAFKEALHNSVKHSQACEVKVSFGCEQRVLLLSVADDGIGIPEKTATSGNGLANMQRRMELIRGEFRVTSQRGRGTQIQLQVKV